jgi:carbonic anhydrase
MSNRETSVCTVGTRQSPIMITSAVAKDCNSLCDLKFFYRTSMCSLINTGNEFALVYDSGSSVQYKNEVYTLDMISYSRPSSHIIDNKKYDAELLLYHVNTINKNMLVISVFLEVNDSATLSKNFLDQFVDYIPSTPNSSKQINLGGEWNIYDVLPETKSFYVYDGSLIKEPCTQNTTCIVMNTPVNASMKFFDKIKTIFPNENNRLVQPINNRDIYFNSNSLPANLKNYGSSVKCYNEQMFRSECSIVSKNSVVEKQKSDSMKLLIIFLLTIIVIAGVLYLIEKGFFSKVGATIANTSNRLGRNTQEGFRNLVNRFGNRSSSTL